MPSSFCRTRPRPPDAQPLAQCIICRAWPAQTLCAQCLRAFAQPQPRCARCAQLLRADGACAHCLLAPPPKDAPDALLAAVDYGWPWHDVVHAFKFGAQGALARPMAQVLLQQHCVCDALAAAQALLPMPLHPQRLAQRGFNQSLALARELLRQSHTAAARLHAHSLLRIRHTVAQSSLPHEQRLRNMRGAFAVQPERADALRGLSVLLVDDVCTSGASLLHAARTLRQAGCAEVKAVVFARTPSQNAH